MGEPAQHRSDGRAASIAPILYFIFVYHYAVNSFDSDDWTVAPLVHAALHGQPTLGLLWGQHHESRLFIGNVIDVLFGFADRLDLRSVMIFSALVLIASYAVLLLLFRKYIGRRLTPIPVLVLGVTWFSLADVQNALWAFQVSWYLAVFFFLLMLCFLLVPNGRRTLWFALAVVVAIAGSLSTVQGFLCWPLGAICILWPTRSPRRRPEIATWLGAMLVTMAVYLVGYSIQRGEHLSRPGTVHSKRRTPSSPDLPRFLLRADRQRDPRWNNRCNPDGRGRRSFRGARVGHFRCGVACSRFTRGVTDRSSERLPLPALIILFSLLFDVTIAVGRGGSGVAGAVNANRFVMANLILLTGIVIYGARTRPDAPPLRDERPMEDLRHIPGPLGPGCLPGRAGDGSNRIRFDERSNGQQPYGTQRLYALRDLRRRITLRCTRA